MYFETEEAFKANFTESLAPRLSKGLMKPGDTLRGFHKPEFRTVGFRISSADDVFNITCTINYIAFPWDDSVSGQAWVMEKLRFIVMEKKVYTTGTLSHTWHTYIEYESDNIPVYILRKLETVAEYEDEVVQMIRGALLKKQASLKERFLAAKKFIYHPEATDEDSEWAEEDSKSLHHEMRRLKDLTVS